MRTGFAPLLLLLALAPSAAQDESETELAPQAEPLLGADADEHGCVGSSGHTWCETLGACIKERESPCPEPCEGESQAEEALYRNLTSGDCVPVSRCNETQVETLAPTATVDRECGACQDWAELWTPYDMAWRVAAIVFLFCGIAVICDDYFTPALEGITEAWELSEDVAGATFMAAGSSAPELFTSLIAVFSPSSACGADTDSVGVGTIVGSAVFNVLVIIGLSGVLGCKPGQLLDLDWRPLLRDSSFYIVSIALLFIFLLDGEVWWQEALAMFSVYASYILFMRFNARICYGKGFKKVDEADEADEEGADPEQGGRGETNTLVVDTAVVAKGSTHEHWGHSLGWVPHSSHLCHLEPPESALGKVRFFIKMMNFCIKNDEFCIKNNEILGQGLLHLYAALDSGISMHSSELQDKADCSWNFLLKMQR